MSSEISHFFLLQKLKTRNKTFLKSMFNETKIETKSYLFYATLVTKPFLSQDKRTQTSGVPYDKPLKKHNMNHEVHA